MDGQLWWIVSMVDKRETAMDLGNEAIASGLAACAQVEGPVTSIYQWKGERHEDREFRIVFKCSPKKVESLMDYLKAHHPYDVPEILAWPVPRADSEYRNWVEGG